MKNGQQIENFIKQTNIHLTTLTDGKKGCPRGHLDPGFRLTTGVSHNEMFITLVPKV